jgi:hypothetical protein
MSDEMWVVNNINIGQEKLKDSAPEPGVALSFPIW